MAAEKQDESHLDAILSQLGDFGKYQIFVVALLALPLVLVCAMQLTFVFCAMNMKHRCETPGCDSKTNPEFEPKWLKHATILHDREEQKNCAQYFKLNENQNCSFNQFDIEYERNCTTYVYESTDLTIMHDFDLHCDDNLWKLTMVGTINDLGEFVGTPIVGFASDSYGRKTVLIWSIFLCILAGIARAFATSYTWYLVFEFLGAFFGGPAYCVGFVLGIELVGPQKRVLIGSFISAYYALGEILMATLAWLVKSWRLFLLILHIPSLICIAFHWILPESVRWLLIRGRNEEAFGILRDAASANGKDISEGSLKELAIIEKEKAESSRYPLLEVFQSNCLMFRLLIWFICWITGSFVFYGLTLNSVALAGNDYLDFILVALVEIPAYIVLYFLMDCVGRRYTQCGAFWLTSFACIAFECFDPESEWLRLSSYLLGKFGATLALCVCHFFTSEMFPTSLRQSFLGWCLTAGRIGSMAAPQVPLLAKLWPPLPLLLYAVMGIIAGLLTLLLPETTNIKLPDTIKESVNIGKKNKETFDLTSYSTFVAKSE